MTFVYHALTCILVHSPLHSQSITRVHAHFGNPIVQKRTPLRDRPPMISSSLEKQLTAALESREARNIRRSLPSPADTALVDFSSNDYLSLSKSPELRTRFLEKLGSTEQILGSGGSRLLINGSAHVRSRGSSVNILQPHRCRPVPRAITISNPNSRRPPLQFRLRRQRRLLRVRPPAWGFHRLRRVHPRLGPRWDEDVPRQMHPFQTQLRQGPRKNFARLEK
jgi:hypothetical protein